MDGNQSMNVFLRPGQTIALIDNSKTTGVPISCNTSKSKKTTLCPNLTIDSFHLVQLQCHRLVAMLDLPDRSVQREGLEAAREWITSCTPLQGSHLLSKPPTASKEPRQLRPRWQPNPGAKGAMAPPRSRIGPQRRPLALGKANY